ncbi:hypothetical protein N0V88_001206 [Collariella sp. IMI 366227]|nr:hypothetical protein N0V88_001206 [Collariella sp. IMI 366227]
MPMFERFCTHVRERWEEVVAMLSKRLRKETELEASNEMATAAEEELARVKRAAEEEIAMSQEQLATAEVAVRGGGK